jgi:serine/threonine protein kinase/tetratricopeptide (TPR) repeat protein
MIMECPNCHAENRDDSRFCSNCGTQLGIGETLPASPAQTLPTPLPVIPAGALIAGKYKIVDEIGRGGMGIVYKAEDTKLKRTVALKFLPPELTRDPEAKARFIHEAQAASALQHNNICTIHDIDEGQDGRIFIVMDYYQGKTLKDRLHIGESTVGATHRVALTIDECINITLQIAQGLQAAHANGIVHRDIKPANIMITAEGVVKILDFGLARLPDQTTLTKPGQRPGTLSYMSPEQLKGNEIKQQTDIWSLGTVIYEMLTGRLPFSGEHEYAVLYSILNEESEPVSTYNPQVPKLLETVVKKCLDKKVDQRYPAASELIKNLEDIRLQISKTEILQPEVKTFEINNFIRKSIIPISVIFILLVSLLLFSSIRMSVKSFFGLSTLPDQKHIAILPCTNVGKDPDNQAFCDGLVETLTSKLTQLEEFQGTLWVVPFSEIRNLRETTVAEAQKQFAVNLAVTSSFQRVSDHIRLTLNLVDAKNLRQINSAVIDDQLKEASMMQDSVLLELAQLLEIECQPEKNKILKAGQTRNPQAFDFYLQGRGHLQNYQQPEQIDIAIGLFEKAISKDPDYALAYAALGEGYWRKYRLLKDTHWFDMAMQSCKQALQIENKLPEVLLTLGLMQASTGQYDLALQSFQQVLTIDSLNDNAYRGMAMSYKYINLPDKAEMNYRKAIQIKPQYWGNHNTLGVFYYHQGRNEDAINQFKKVIELTPENIKGYTNLGGIYFQLGRWDEAQKIFEKAINIEPSYQAYSNLGDLYFYQHHFDQAIQMYQKALALSDQDYVVWAGLAEAYRWQGVHAEEVKEYFQEAKILAEKQLLINPRDIEVQADLAGYYLGLGDTSKTVRLLDQVISEKPVKVETYFQIAVIFEYLGRRDQALWWITKAVQEGFSRSQIENHPGLAALCADPDYQMLMKR